MILSLPIPSGRYHLIIKYFGYNPNNFYEFNININERTISNDIEEIIIEELNTAYEDKKNEKKKINKNISKKRKINKKKNIQIDNNNEINNNENNINSIELILLNKDKKIYKILNKNEKIFEYINNGYEIVAYEKEIINNTNSNENDSDDFSENIYFYLVQYLNEHFLWIYPYIYKNILFEYPLTISINSNQTIFNIYEKIYIYIREIKLNHYFQKEELLNINDSFNNISYRNEKSTGFLIYINPNKKLKNQI